MIKMNKKMINLINKTNHAGSQLPKELEDLIDQGFVEEDGCFFIFSQFEKMTNASKSNFQDKTGHECFINSIHIDDFVKKDYIINSLLFVNSIFCKLPADKNKIKAIVVADDAGALVKIHSIREGEFWIDDNLDEYADAVFTAEFIDIFEISKIIESRSRI